MLLRRSLFAFVDPDSVIVTQVTLHCVFFQDNSLLPVGGQPGGNSEAAGDERAPERHAEVAAEPSERRHGAQGDVRPRHRTLLQGGGLHADGEGHEDAGHFTGYEPGRVL